MTDSSSARAPSERVGRGLPDAEGRSGVSIIIPTRGTNCRSKLLVQLAAIYSQDFDGGIEIIVADNGPARHRSIELVAPTGWSGILRVIDVRGAPSKGRAVNAAARAANSDILLLLDSDDEIDRHYVRVMVSRLQSEHIAAGRVDSMSLNTGIVATSRVTEQWHGLCSGFSGPAFALGCALGTQRAAFLALGGYDEWMKTHEDVDFSWRAMLAGYSIGFEPLAVVRYRSRQSLASLVRQEYRYGRGAIHLAEKYAELSWAQLELSLAVRRAMKAMVVGFDLRSFVQVLRSLGFATGCMAYRLQRMNRDRKLRWRSQ